MEKENVTFKNERHRTVITSSVVVPSVNVLNEMCDRMIFEAQESHPQVFHDLDMLRLYIPHIVIEMMIREQADLYRGFHHSNFKMERFRGIKVYEGYEMAFVLAHVMNSFDPERMTIKKMIVTFRTKPPH